MAVVNLSLDRTFNCDFKCSNAIVVLSIPCFNSSTTTSICKNTEIKCSISVNLVSRTWVTFEPPHGKTNNLHMRKQRRRSASR